MIDYDVSVLMTDAEGRAYSDAQHRAEMFEACERDCRAILAERSEDNHERHIWLRETIDSIRAARKERDIMAGLVNVAKERRRIIDATKALAARVTPDGPAVLLRDVFAVIDLAQRGGAR